MDIFGIGAAEIVVICLVILIVAGPKRSATWARQAGVYMRQFQMAWQNMWNEMKDELGPEGEELVKTAHDLRQTATDLRRATSTRNIVGQTVNLVERTDPARLTSKSHRPGSAANGGNAEPSSTPPATAEDDRYSAWRPQTDQADGADTDAGSNPN